MPESKPTRQKRRIATALELRGIKPEAKPFEVSDTKAPGLRLRLHPSGRGAWLYVYREPRANGRQGKLHRIKLGEYPGMGLEAARKARGQWAGQRSADGADDPHEVIAEKAREKAAQEHQAAADAARGVWTVRRLAADWIEACKRTTRERTWRETERQLNREVCPVIGAVPADEVTALDIAKVLKPIERRRKIRQRNAVRTTCVMLWNWARAHGPDHLRGGANPAEDVPVLRAKPLRGRRAFTEGELRAVWGRLKSERGDATADALALALLCGTRASETVGAKWREIDLAARTWQIPSKRTKSGRAHLVYLSEPAVALLKARQRPRGYVFAMTTTAAGHVRHDALSKALRARMTALDLEPDLTPHELRHSLLTAVVGRFRMPQEVRRRVANHVSGDALERVYVHHSFDEESREAWARWGAYLDGLISGAKVVELRPGAGA